MGAFLSPDHTGVVITLGDDDVTPPSDACRPIIRRITIMAKGQKRSNKEVKKPKQTKVAAPAPASFEKGLTATGYGAKKKG